MKQFAYLKLPFSVFCFAMSCMPHAFSQQADSVNHRKNAVARLLWQDGEAPKLKWSNVAAIDSKWSMDPQPVSGLPTIDSGVRWVQMELLNDMVIVGAHDDNEGKTQSGWIAIHSGLYDEEHGDHSHTRFDKPPHTVKSALDTEQGNPAHVYRYGSKIFLANDKKNGFTVLGQGSSTGTAGSMINAKFYSGGGNHITLAATPTDVVFATWADRDGENAGRVDIVNIENPSASGALLGSMKLPSGGLHGATIVGNKVFFAPSDGVCFIKSDLNYVPKEMDIQHVSLGTDSVTNKPIRTGAFTVSGDYALFTAGGGSDAHLHLLYSRSEKPKLQSIPLSLGTGLIAMTPRCFVASDKKPMALCFAERRGSVAQESLVVISLDPNGDTDYSDARIMKSIDVGPSKIEGHSGYHDVAISRNGRYAFVTIPGEGTIWILSTSTWEWEGKINVGGTPTRILSM
jgi:hypothetical protein